MLVLCVCMCAFTCVCNIVSNKSQVIQVHWEYSSKMIFIFAILIRETQLLQDRINTINVVSTLSLSPVLSVLKTLNSVRVQHRRYQYHGSDSVHFSYNYTIRTNVNQLTGRQPVQKPTFFKFFCNQYLQVHTERLQALKENISV